MVSGGFPPEPIGGFIIHSAASIVELAQSKSSSGVAKENLGLGERNPSQATGLTERKPARPVVDRL
jgi:hypothetical protein